MNLSAEKLEVKKRILASACSLFALHGFNGTRIRHICRDAEVNIAAVFYYFRSKEILYISVVTEAGCRLAAAAKDSSNRLASAAPEARLTGIVESLFDVLNEDHAWIAKLLARLLSTPSEAHSGWAGLGVQRYVALLEHDMMTMAGFKTANDPIRLHALSVIGNCVFYSMAIENMPNLALGHQHPLPPPETLARHIASLSIVTLRDKNAAPGE